MIFNNFRKNVHEPEMDKPYVAVVIAAAGSSSRMRGIDKQFEEIGDVPVLVHTMRALAQSEWIDEMVIVTRAQDIPLVMELIRAYALTKVRSVVAGATSRQESVQNGISAVNTQTQYVAIHDGARPFVSQQVIAEAVISAIRYGAAAAAVPVVDTVKTVNTERMVMSTPERALLYAVQTPQVFALEQYRAAALAAETAGIHYTDDSQMLEAIGQPVYLSDGAYENMKITTPIDLITARAIAEQEEVEF